MLKPRTVDATSWYSVPSVSTQGEALQRPTRASRRLCTLYASGSLLLVTSVGTADHAFSSVSMPGKSRELNN
jgi:hypothetical protein